MSTNVESYAQDEKFADEAQEERVEANLPPQDMSANQALAAYHGALREHQQTVRHALRTGKKATLWMLVLGLITIVDRLNEALLNGFQALPSFQKEFGVVVHKKGSNLTYTLTAQQQQLLGNIPQVWHVAGLLVYGVIIDRFGNRYCTMAALTMILGTIAISFFSHNFAMILVGTSFQTLLTGFTGATAPAWCMELAPLALRPYVLIYVHLMNNVGQLLATVMNQHYSTRLDPMAWRIPYAIQWAFPLPLLIAIWFAPESPWWCIRHNKQGAALKNLARLHNGEIDDDEVLALIQHTVNLEKQLKFSGSFWHCFRGTNLRRTEIAFMASLALDLTNFGLKGPAYFLQAAGLKASDAFALSCGQNALGIVGTILAAVVIRTVGRRGMWLWGSAGLATNLAIIGALALAPHQTPSVIWPQGVFVMIQKLLLSISIGALSSILTTEIGSVQLRRKTQAIGLIGYDASDFVSGAVSPYLVNPTEANLKGKAAWIPCGFNVLMFIYGYFRVPETRGRNSEELDILFANKVSARKFATYKIDTAQEFGVKEEVVNTAERRMQEETVPTLE